MSQGSHIIKSKVLEVSFDQEKEAMSFQKRLAELVREEISEITERCLSNFDGISRQYIHRLELDLGDLPYRAFERELPVIYEKELMKALSAKLGHLPRKTETDEDKRVDLVSMVRYFLIKSYMPWNYNDSNWTSFQDMFDQAMRTDMQLLIDDLNLLLKSESARVRLINHLSEKQIRQLVQKIEPTQADLIISYHEEWLKTEKERLVFKTDKAELAKQLWLFIFNYLYDDRGSYFNTRAFLISTLRQISGHFNLPFQFTISLLRDSYYSQSVLSRRGGFSTIIKDILDEFDTPGKKETTEVSSDHHYSIADITYYLSHGRLPANDNFNAYKFEKSITRLIEGDKAEMIRLLRGLTNQQGQVLRLIKPLSDTSILKIVNLLSPGNGVAIQAYHGEVVKAQKRKAIVQAPAYEFPKIIWSIIITILADDYGSGFNRKTFLRGLIQKTALRFNLSYKVLLQMLKSSLEQMEETEQPVHALKLINEIYLEDFGKKRKRKDKVIDFKSIDLQWIESSIIKQKLHVKITKAGYHTVREFVAFFAEKEPDRLARLISKSIDKPDFLRQVMKSMDRQVLSRLAQSKTGISASIWLSTFDLITGMASLEIVNPAVRQTAIREFLLRWIFTLSGSANSRVEHELVVLAKRQGLDFNELLRSLIWLSRETGNKEVLKPLLDIADKFKIDYTTRSFKWLSKPSEAVEQSPGKQRVSELVELVIFSLEGRFSQVRAAELGFTTIEEVIAYLTKHHPQVLKNGLAGMKAKGEALPGIGRELTLDTYYELLNLLDLSVGRSMVLLLNKLQAKLNTGTQNINRFLSLLRSMALCHVSANTFHTEDFLNDFVKLLSRSSRGVYLQVIPVLTSQLSSLALPGNGSVQNVIDQLEWQFNHEDELPPVTDGALKEIMRKEFFKKGLEKESTVTPWFEETTEKVFDEIYIENAGLVLLSAYLPTLFDRAGLTAEGVFTTDENRERAVLLMQYLLLDEPPLEEHYLALNKVICGLPIADPMKTSLDITSEETELIDGLIQAVIQHWSVIRNSSVEGFRGDWLWRKGKLEQKEDVWELNIESSTYDILLDQLPFSYSPIKYSWMEKPIVVNWR
ncbi:MAG: hypothetical protein HEP71_04480 [Roseivirga sp.]|nr:hypothetical protein [Roseivirga sp.]